MNPGTIQERIDAAIGETERGRVSQALELLLDLYERTAGVEWLEVLVTTELAEQFMVMGMYNEAHSVANYCHKKIQSVQYPPAGHTYRLLEPLIAVQTLLAAMYGKSMVNSTDGWELGLRTIESELASTQEAKLSRQYTLLVRYLLQIAIWHKTFRYPEAVGMKEVATSRFLKITAPLCRNQRSSDALDIVLRVCQLEDDSRRKILLLLAFLSWAYRFSSPHVIGRAYLNISIIYTEWDLKLLPVARKYYILARTYLLSCDNLITRLACEELEVDQREKVSNCLHYTRNRFKYMDLHNKYRELGRFDKAQVVLLKGANSERNNHEYLLFYSFCAIAEELDNNLGGTRLGFLNKLFQMLGVLCRGGHSLKLLEALGGLYPRISEMGVPFLSGLHARICSIVYSQMGKVRTSILWARICSIWWEACDERQEGEGVRCYLEAMYAGMTKGTIPKDDIAILPLRAKAALWAQMDTEAARWQDVVADNFLIAKFENLLSSMPASAVSSGLKRAFELAQTNLTPDEGKRVKYRIMESLVDSTLSSPQSKDAKLRALSDLREAVRRIFFRSFDLQDIRRFISVCVNVWHLLPQDTLSTKVPDIYEATSRMLHMEFIGKGIYNERLMDIAAAAQNLGAKLRDNCEAEQDLTATIDTLNEAADYTTIALLLAESLKNTSLSAAYAMSYSLCYYKLQGLSRTPQTISKAENAISLAEKCFKRERLELCRLSGAVVVHERQRLSGLESYLSLMKFDLSLAQNRGLSAWLSIINSKARSIADTLGLGGIVPESLCQELKAFDPESWAILDTYLNLSKQIEQTPSVDRLLLRSVQEDYFLREIEERWRLKEIFTFLTGRPVSGMDVLSTLYAEESDEDSSQDEPKIKLIDWFLWKGRIYLSIFDGENPPSFNALSIFPSTVEKWLSTYFYSAHGFDECMEDIPDNPESPFRELDDLIAPLAWETKENDYLVFFPCKLLYAIPLHALSIQSSESDQRVTLIERNYIVYSASLGVFLHCWKRSLQSQPCNENRQHHGLSCYIGVYEDEKDVGDVERDAIHKHVRDLASNDSEILTGTEATKANFKNAAQEAKLIHFHGHCNFREDDILRQCLILAGEGTRYTSDIVQGLTDIAVPDMKSDDLEHTDSSEHDDELQFDGGGCHNSDSDSSSEDFFHLASWTLLSSAIENKSPITQEMAAINLARDEDESAAIKRELHYTDKTNDEITVNEILGLDLSQNPLVILMACGSAVQHVGIGDEPMGMATAFLCAGAGSFIGTLWEIWSPEARRFASSFYQRLREQQNSRENDWVEGQRLIDLAAVIRYTICELIKDSETRKYRFWAAFTLQGAPFLSWPGDSNWEAFENQQ